MTDNKPMRDLLLRSGALSAEGTLHILSGVDPSDASDDWDLSQLPAANALSIADRHWKFATLVAKTTPHVDVLDRLSRHSSLNVRDAVAANPKTSEKTARLLLDWSLKYGRLDSVASTARHLSFMERFQMHRELGHGYHTMPLLVPSLPAVRPVFTTDDLGTVVATDRSLLHLAAVELLMTARPSNSAIAEAFDAAVGLDGDTHAVVDALRVTLRHGVLVDHDIVLISDRLRGLPALVAQDKVRLRFTTADDAVKAAQVAPWLVRPLLTSMNLPHGAALGVTRAFAALPDKQEGIRGPWEISHLFNDPDLPSEVIDTLTMVPPQTLAQFIGGRLVRKPQPGEAGSILRRLEPAQRAQRSILLSLAALIGSRTLDNLPAWFDEIVDALGGRWPEALKVFTIDLPAGVWQPNWKWQHAYLARRLAEIPSTDGDYARELAAAQMIDSDLPTSEILTSIRQMVLEDATAQL